jgi:hypothetical protein
MTLNLRSTWEAASWGSWVAGKEKMNDEVQKILAEASEMSGAEETTATCYEARHPLPEGPGS